MSEHILREDALKRWLQAVILITVTNNGGHRSVRASARSISCMITVPLLLLNPSLASYVIILIFICASDSSATITARWLLANGHLIFCLIFHYYPSANFYHDHHHHHDLQSKYNIITIPLKIKVKNMLFRCNISSPMLLSQKLDHSFEFAIFNPGFQACCYISLLVFQVIVF